MIDIPRHWLASISLLTMLVFQLAAAQEARPFTYQGELRQGNSPADGSYDFEFRLYREASGSDQLGSPVTLGAVPVRGGVFSVVLDFGDDIGATPAFLDIRVRTSGSADNFTHLEPRLARLLAGHPRHGQRQLH